jgi:hypothetical protein
MIGLENTDTQYVVMAEHDILYSHEHLSWTPPCDDTFYYNFNHWIVRYEDGMYSYWKNRYALSQLVCNRELLMRATKERLDCIEKGLLITKGLRGAGEPGVADASAMETPLERIARKMASGRSVTAPEMVSYLTPQKAEGFKTTIPNLDIRHGGNFTGNKRGNNRTWEIPYWGSFKKLMED